MSSKERAFPAQGEDEVMNYFLRTIQNEQPKIDASIKNFLSVLIGRSHGDIGPRVVSGLSSSSILMDYARLFLSCLQSTGLPTVEEYCAANPQSTTQSALDRLDEVCRYKAHLAYREHGVRSGLKVSKLFGKGFFTSTRIFPDIKALFLARLESDDYRHLTRDEGDRFIGLYERSIFGTDAETNEGDLVWSTNFQESLRQRQLKRVQLAKARAEEESSQALLREEVGEHDEEPDTASQEE